MKVFFIFSIIIFHILIGQNIQSGQYNSTKIGVSGNRLTGYYQNCTAECKFSCFIFFEGKITNSTFEIVSYFPEFSNLIKGTIQEISPGSIKIKLVSEHGGCWNVEPDFNKGGVDLKIHKKEDWIEIRMVSSQKAFFYSDPENSNILKSYVIKNDSLAILEKKPSWLFGQFNNGNIKTKGWLKESDFYSLKVKDSK